MYFILFIYLLIIHLLFISSRLNNVSSYSILVFYNLLKLYRFKLLLKIFIIVDMPYPEAHVLQTCVCNSDVNKTKFLRPRPK